MEIQKFNYDNTIVKNFILATLVWGAVALLVGLVAALEIAFPCPQFRIGIHFLWQGQAGAYQCGHLCLYRQCHFCRRLLLTAAGC